ncbi:DUF3828 domain-containing protein [Flavobacterium chilense]|uniref:Uncharacterized protein n=1 Tax=Flavobacterium chilense TaxID=946677 RepID=A0A1M6XXI0_9FLAO|nr:DUF3828 domain-containing protein [Flavobacterium chilense]SHL10701.1 Protein of unknown function [Flavobacterium chilense]
MKFYKLFFLSFIWILLAGFKPVNTSFASAKSIYFASDKQQLETLIRKTYEWIETKNLVSDFDPLENKKGTQYVGVNLKAHNKKLSELKNSNFFSQQFLDNYNKIALAIDTNLKNKKMEWLVGDLPPFGNDSNPWCNCQDYPDDYWKTLTINNLKIDKNEAIFNWSWSLKDNFKYKVKAVKENGIWKIAYLEGFDFKSYTQF